MDSGVTTGGDVLGHVLSLGQNKDGAFTPDGILDAANTLQAQCLIVAKEIFDAQPDVDDDFFNDWSRFYLSFTQWRTANTSWISRAWNSTRDELVGFINQYNGLRNRWAPTKAQPLIVGVAPSNTLADLGAKIGVALTNVAWGAAALAGVVVVGVVAVRYLK